MQWFEGGKQQHSVATRRPEDGQEGERDLLASLWQVRPLAGFRRVSLVLLDESEMSHSTMRKSSLRDAHNNLLPFDQRG